MTASRSKTKRHLSDKHSPQRSGRYIAITLGLAAFLLVLAFGRLHSDRFVAVAQLTAVCSNRQNPWSDGLRLQQTICRALPLEQTAADLCRDGIPGAKSLDVARLRDQVALRIQPDSTPLFVNFSLSFTSNNPDTSIAFVNHLGNWLTCKRFENRAFAQEIAIGETAWHIVPASSTERTYRTTPLVTFLSASLAGVIAAICAVYSNGRTATVETNQMAKTFWKVPLLGTIGESNPRRQSPPAARSQLFDVLLSMSEWILCGMLLAVLLASVLDKSFANHFLSQPVSALADAVRHLVKLPWS
ncbi:MAG: hypothetical protein QF408_02660 [Pirellulales bacterium]|jgi:hypothetical protein|nr:hypothetical protein [Pirellulales bacterium]HJN67207.1 hypothetical protein [Pirellulales bacterium]